MSDIDAILGLKRELKAARKKVSDLKAQSESWRSVAETMRDLLGLDEGKFRNLAQSKGLSID
jgi:hypothetical protein